MSKYIEKIRKRRTLFQEKLIGFLSKKESANEQLIVALVMIAISVALVIIFKDKINTLLTSFMNNVTSKINTALGV